MRMVIAGLVAALTLGAGAQAQETARGVVYLDANGNGTRDAGEGGIAHVPVSNGTEVVLTDEDGAYALPVDDDTIIFVNKPAGYMTPVTEAQLPRFHYIHKPNGSPDLKYPGVEPTGPLPESIDFPLLAHEDREQFRVLLFGDTQPYSIEEIHWIARDVVAELVGADVAFGVSLGDLVGDQLDFFEHVNAVNAMVGVPFYNILGNHDIDFASPNDEHSDETFEAVFGPPYYAFAYGKAHFLVLDDVEWTGDRYYGLLGEEQLTFVENYLKHVPADSLIVPLMHIPLIDVEDRARLFELIQPFENTFSLAAHWHRQIHFFMDEEDGWTGEEPHHHLVHATVCGSWWNGFKDPVGIPVTTMSDGAPNGYSFLTIDGTDYKVTFKAARRPAEHQMHIHRPDDIRQGTSQTQQLTVNVFAGSERSTVEYRVAGHVEWQAMNLNTQPDPYYAAKKEAEAWLAEEFLKSRPDADPEDFNINSVPGFTRHMGERLPGLRDSTHIWIAELPTDLPVGWHQIDVRTTDMFGQTYEDRTFFRVY